MNKEMLSNKISLLCFLMLTDFLSRFADMGFVCLTAEKKIQTTVGKDGSSLRKSLNKLQNISSKTNFKHFKWFSSSRSGRSFYFMCFRRRFIKLDWHASPQSLTHFNFLTSIRCKVMELDIWLRPLDTVFFSCF